MRTAAAKTRSEYSGKNFSRACALQISSDWASVIERETSETGGSIYPYRCSKSALNMGMKNLSIDLKNDGILVLAMHPGWVRTDMGGRDAPLTVDNSVKTMLQTLATLGDKDHGSFVQFDGTPLPW